VLETRNFRHVRTAESVIPYVLGGGLYCLKSLIDLKEVPARPYIVWG
jgi:hypothetical protein